MNMEFIFDNVNWNFMCKMIISPAALFNFSVFDFRGCQGMKGQKMTQNNKKFYLFKIMIFCYFRGIKGKILTKISVCHALYLRNCRSYHQDFWFTGVLA